MTLEIEIVAPRVLGCGLPVASFAELRNVTALARLNEDEARCVFDCLHELGFKVVKAD